MKDTDLKHLTLKTAFLLALASGKCCSEIHAWVANKVSNLSQWEKVALFPSSYFIAKNQLAREGSQSLSPMTIPALTTIMDRQFKEDRTLFTIWIEPKTLPFLCHQHLFCVAYRDCFVISFCGVVCRPHTLFSGQYLKNAKHRNIYVSVTTTRSHNRLWWALYCYFY